MYVEGLSMISSIKDVFCQLSGLYQRLCDARLFRIFFIASYRCFLTCYLDWFHLSLSSVERNVRMMCVHDTAHTVKMLSLRMPLC